jgi:hypothetical protein
MMNRYNIADEFDGGLSVTTEVQTIEQEYLAYTTPTVLQRMDDIVAFWEVSHLLVQPRMTNMPTSAQRHDISDHQRNREGLHPHPGNLGSVRTNFLKQCRN